MELAEVPVFPRDLPGFGVPFYLDYVFGVGLVLLAFLHHGLVYADQELGVFQEFG